MNRFSTAGEDSCKINTNIEVMKNWISLRKQMRRVVKTKGLFNLQKICPKLKRKATVKSFFSKL